MGNRASMRKGRGRSVIAAIVSLMFTIPEVGCRSLVVAVNQRQQLFSILATLIVILACQLPVVSDFFQEELRRVGLIPILEHGGEHGGVGALEIAVEHLH